MSIHSDQTDTGTDGETGKQTMKLWREGQADVVCRDMEVNNQEEDKTERRRGGRGVKNNHVCLFVCLFVCVSVCERACVRACVRV